MVNTSAQGAALERLVINILTEEHGYDCIRSAASKGAVDVVAVHPSEACPCPCDTRLAGGPLLFIQCKLSDPLISPAERRALLDLSLRADAVPIVAWRPPGKRKGTLSTTPAYRELTGPGPKEWRLWTPGEDD